MLFSLATPLHQYLRDAVPTGSAAHYALLFAPQAQREPLACLYWYWREMLQLARHYRHPQTASTVAVVRAGWWAQTLQTLALDEQRHPVNHAFQQLIAAGQLSLDDLSLMLSGASLIYSPQLPDAAARDTAVWRLYGHTIWCAAKLCASNADAAQMQAVSQAFGKLIFELEQLKTVHKPDYTALKTHTAAARASLAKLRTSPELKALKPIIAACLMILKRAENAVNKPRLSLNTISPIRKLWMAATA